MFSGIIVYCTYGIYYESVPFAVNLSYAQAEELYYLLTHLYKQEDRVFEVKDAVIALTVPDINPGRLHSHAVSYLSNNCSTCFESFPRHEMANLCCHDTSEQSMAFCKGCAARQFTIFIQNEVRWPFLTK